MRFTIAAYCTCCCSKYTRPTIPYSQSTYTSPLSTSHTQPNLNNTRTSQGWHFLVPLRLHLKADDEKWEKSSLLNNFVRFASDGWAPSWIFEAMSKNTSVSKAIVLFALIMTFLISLVKYAWSSEILLLLCRVQIFRINYLECSMIASHTKSRAVVGFTPAKISRCSRYITSILPSLQATLHHPLTFPRLKSFLRTSILLPSMLSITTLVVFISITASRTREIYEGPQVK